MSSRSWVRNPPAQFDRNGSPTGGSGSDGTGLCRARALTCSWADKPPGPTGEEVAASQRRWQDCRKVQQLAPGPHRAVTSLYPVAGNRSRLPFLSRGGNHGFPTQPGGRDVTASIRGREPRCVGSNPTGRLVYPCGRRAPASSARCNRVAHGCGGSTPPVRTRPDHAKGGVPPMRRSHRHGSRSRTSASETAVSTARRSSATAHGSRRAASRRRCA